MYISKIFKIWTFGWHYSFYGLFYSVYDNSIEIMINCYQIKSLSKDQKIFKLNYKEVACVVPVTYCLEEKVKPIYSSNWRVNIKLTIDEWYFQNYYWGNIGHFQRIQIEKWKKKWKFKKTSCDSDDLYNISNFLDNNKIYNWYNAVNWYLVLEKFIFCLNMGFDCLKNWRIY